MALSNKAEIKVGVVRPISSLGYPENHWEEMGDAIKLSIELASTSTITFIAVNVWKDDLSHHIGQRK